MFSKFILSWDQILFDKTTSVFILFCLFYIVKFLVKKHKLIRGSSHATMSVPGVFFYVENNLCAFSKENIAIIFPPVPFSLWSLGRKFRFTFKEVTFQFTYNQLIFFFVLCFFFFFHFSFASSILNVVVMFILCSGVRLGCAFFPVFLFCFVLLFIMCSIFPLSKINVTLILARKGG